MKVIQMLVGQMQVFAYLVGCEKTGEAIVIDPAGNEDAIVAQGPGKRPEDRQDRQHPRPPGPHLRQRQA